MAPIFVFVLNVIFLKEKISGREMVGLFLSFMGVFLTIKPNMFKNLFAYLIIGNAF